MGMAWFEQEAIDFFRELELNNDRAWFEQNKKRYEAKVKLPMEAFADHMIGKMKELLPDIQTTGKKAVFRIYRDTRFSKDKTPYKTNAGIHINDSHKGDLQSAGLYFHIDPRRMAIASGRYMIEPAKLKNLRIFLMDNLPEFQVQLNDPEFKKYFGSITGEKNKILPPELKEAASQQPLLFNKQFYYWAEYEAEEALRDDLDEFIMEHMRSCSSMNEFLSRV
jgi:uncharacterized protein (TIGR02453 family)